MNGKSAYNGAQAPARRQKNSSNPTALIERDLAIVGEVFLIRGAEGI